MYIDRPQSIEFVNGKPVGNDTDWIDIDLLENDLNRLADPAIAYTTDRFMGCTENGSINGWAPEDKIHIKLETPLESKDDNKVAELQLDPGGDLYFTIWNSSALQAADQHSEFIAEAPFLTSDPSNKLGEAGIKAVRFHNMVDLAERLQK
jgi:hypothetical protein